jgi:tRNA dimethylallyltransferase
MFGRIFCTSLYQMIFILGPTASGKSALAMAVAQQLPIEIISVDSAQVFQQMNVGTAKPSLEDMATVPHHLINIISPEQVFSAAQFALQATRLEGEIKARGNLPVCVGGTMLYVSALTQGLNDLPSANAEIRAALNAEAEEHGWPSLHQRLLALDPKAAAKIQPMDAQRIQRALEVIMLTGKTISEQQSHEKLAINNDGKHLVISLEPSDRLALHSRIETRLKLMYAQGLIDEVRQLRALNTLSADMPSMRCVGYRQVWEALDLFEGLLADLDAENHGITRHSFPLALAATRQLAKRQLTWLRANEKRHTFDCLHNTATLLQPTLKLIEQHG